jgi:hypothetical protein
MIKHQLNFGLKLSGTKLRQAGFLAAGPASPDHIAVAVFAMGPTSTTECET